jgi:hypothetical protein
MRSGIYYVPDIDYLAILSRVSKTLIVDSNGVEGVVWLADVETVDGKVGRGYVSDTSELVYIGSL